MLEFCFGGPKENRSAVFQFLRPFPRELVKYKTKEQKKQNKKTPKTHTHTHTHKKRIREKERNKKKYVKVLRTEICVEKDTNDWEQVRGNNSSAAHFIFGKCCRVRSKLFVNGKFTQRQFPLFLCTVRFSFN